MNSGKPVIKICFIVLIYWHYSLKQRKKDISIFSYLILKRILFYTQFSCFITYSYHGLYHCNTNNNVQNVVSNECHICHWPDAMNSIVLIFIHNFFSSCFCRECFLFPFFTFSMSSI